MCSTLFVPMPHTHSIAHHMCAAHIPQPTRTRARIAPATSQPATVTPHTSQPNTHAHTCCCLLASVFVCVVFANTTNTQ